MARMIPNVELTEILHASEAPVYEALRDLGDQFVVLHSYPWLRPTRGDGALREGEADFVLLHRELGILILEVKGGSNIRHDGRSWFRDNQSGPKTFQDPFVQAQRNMHSLLDLIEERSNRRIERSDLTYGYAVVFPQMEYEGKPPPNADKAIILTKRNLSFIDQAVRTAYRAWSATPRPVSEAQWDSLLRDCLLPKFRIFRPVGPDLDLVTDKLLELTEVQAQAFEGLYAQTRVLVEGVAGSGKTFLALQRAIAFAKQGRHVLFTCYNKELATWLRSQVEEDPSLSSCREFLTVRNFHALASEIAFEAHIPFRAANGGPPTEHFWDNEVPDILEQAAFVLEGMGRRVRYGALVVDEAQDFSVEWWYALTQSLLATSDAPIYAFMDPNQSLRGAVTPPPIDFATRFELRINCRNTRRIATASASILGIESQPFTRAPNGIQPRIVVASTERLQSALMVEEIKRLMEREGVRPHQIVLLGSAAKNNGSLSNVEKIGQVPLVTSAEEWRKGGSILVSTARSFKGLEADVVVLYDVGEFGKLFQKSDLYVACTRARALLIAVVHGSECRAAIEAAFVASD